MVILHYDMPAINVGVELLQTEAHWQTLKINVHIGSLNISNSFTGKGYGVTTLKQGSPQPILTSVCLHHNRLRSVIVHKGCIEQGLADPGFEALEGCICRGVPVLLSKLFM